MALKIWKVWQAFACSSPRQDIVEPPLSANLLGHVHTSFFQACLMYWWKQPWCWGGKITKRGPEWLNYCLGGCLLCCMTGWPRQTGAHKQKMHLESDRGVESKHVARQCGCSSEWDIQVSVCEFDPSTNIFHMAKKGVPKAFSEKQRDAWGKYN